MWFTRVSIGNPVFATMLMLGLLVLGVFSYGRLSVEQFPSVDFPVVVVNTRYVGAAPEVVESDITRHIEEAVNTISGLKTLTSRSYEGQSLVIAEFDLKTDPNRAAQDVREKVAGARAGFRKEIDEPVGARCEREGCRGGGGAVGSASRGRAAVRCTWDRSRRASVTSRRPPAWPA